MKFGDPVIYECPSCKKKMRMITYSSYTTKGGTLYSDGMNTGSPNIASDLAKCPNCAAVFFRHNIKKKETMNSHMAEGIKKIVELKRIDYINALETGTAKNRKEEKQIREDLWRSLNDTSRYGSRRLSERLLKIYKENCKALAALTEKSLNKIKKKNNGSNDNNHEISIIMLAELNRNLGNFEECIKILNNLEAGKNETSAGLNWYWLTEQFEWECKRENTNLFELLSKNEMYLDNNETAKSHDYYMRGRKFVRLKYYDKALEDFNKAEDIGSGDINLFLERGMLYEDILRNPDKAMDDYNKALSISDKNGKAGALKRRSNLYKINGDLSSALNDINDAISASDTWTELYRNRKEIREMLGDTEAAQSDEEKIKLLTEKELTHRISSDDNDIDDSLE